VSNYRAPQESEDVDDVTRELQEKGCGVKTPPSSPPEVSEDEDAKLTKKHKKGSILKLRRRVGSLSVFAKHAQIVNNPLLIAKGEGVRMLTVVTKAEVSKGGRLVVRAELMCSETLADLKVILFLETALLCGVVLYNLTHQE
jgi:hypothetical protein